MRTATWGRPLQRYQCLNSNTDASVIKHTVLSKLLQLRHSLPVSLRTAMTHTRLRGHR